MKAAIAILLGLCALSSVSCLPHGGKVNQSADSLLDCEPADGWQVIWHWQTGFGDDWYSYTLGVGTELEGQLSDEDTERLFQLFGEKLGENGIKLHSEPQSCSDGNCSVLRLKRIFELSLGVLELLIFSL